MRAGHPRRTRSWQSSDLDRRQMVARMPRVCVRTVVREVAVGVVRLRRAVERSHLICRVETISRHRLRQPCLREAAGLLNHAAVRVVCVLNVAHRIARQRPGHRRHPRVVVVSICQQDAVGQGHRALAIRVVISDWDRCFPG